MKSNWNLKDLRIEVIRYITDLDGQCLINELASRFEMDNFEMIDVIQELKKRGQVDFDEKEVWLKEKGTFKKKGFDSYFK